MRCVLPCFWRIFYIPRTCSEVPQKIFYIDVKSPNTHRKRRKMEISDMILAWFCPDFKKSIVVRLETRRFFLCVVRSWFKMRCVPLLLEKLLYTQNMFISGMENFLHRRKLWMFCNRDKIKPKSGQKFPSFSVFWVCLLTLRRCKKISMSLMNMFWVCKNFFRSRGTHRILNQGLRHIENKTTHFKAKIVQKMTQTYI